MAATDLTTLLTSLGSTRSNIDGVGLDGGLNLKTDPIRLQPPSTTRADNAWYLNPGNVSQLPAPYSLFNDTPTPYPPYHIYNLGTRDLSSPASTGDMLVHGEYVDTGTTYDAGNVPTGFTRPLWAFNNARTVNNETACLPFSMRVRPLAASLGISSTTANKTPTVYGNQLLFAREEGAVSRRRFVVGAIQNYVFKATAGYVDGLNRTVAFNYGANVVAADLIGVLGASQAALLCVGSDQTTLYTMQFSGFQQNSVVIPSPVNYNAPNAQFMNHGGRTYLLYAGSSSNTTLFIRDVLTGAVTQLLNNTTTVPASVSGASPYALQAQTDVSYFAAVNNRTLFVFGVSTTGLMTAVASIVLPSPNTAVTSGTYNYATTVACFVADSQGGVGANAKIGIVVFSHFPELAVNPGYGPAASPGYQSVCCSKYMFQAAASSPATALGTLTSVTNNVFRTPAGAGLVSKAFVSNPSEAAYAGPTAAKHAMVVVQSGAVEPDSQQVYNQTSIDLYPSADRDSQPTYFIIDQNADIVGRFLEGAAATRPANLAFTASGNGLTNTNASFPGVGSLATPLISDGAGTGDDVSCLNITIPVWGSLNPIPFPTNYALYTDTTVTPNQVSRIPFQTRRIASMVYTPQAMTLTFNGANASTPALNVGAHTYIGGPCPMVHDGAALTEQNYHFGAHNIVLTGTPPSGTGSFGYLYYIVYKWYDAQGRQHRSQPSIASTVVSGSATTPGSITYNVPLINTTKGISGLPVTADIYRTQANNTDDTAYLVDTVTVPMMPKDTGKPTMFVTLAPASQSTLRGDLTAQPLMYTSANAVTAGRTFYAAPPRQTYWQATGMGRCFSLSQTSGQQRIYYSSVASDVLPFEWNPLNYAPVPPDIGDARSIEVLDSTVVVFGTRGVASMTGPGPDTGGTVPVPTPNTGYSPVTPIPAPGCLGTGAPARIPDGVIYQGYSGMQLLGRDLSVSPIGAPVDVLTGREVGTTGTPYGKAAALPSLQSVVWPNPRGASLVYAYQTQRWSTWPLLPNTCALVQRLDGSVWVGTQPIVGCQLRAYGSGVDLSSLGYVYAPLTPLPGPGVVVETPWVAVAGSTSGEADLWAMELIGTWRGPHIVQVEQAYNYGAYSLTQTIDMSVAPLTYQTRWRPLANSRVYVVRYRITLLPVTTLTSGYRMADLADLVIHCDNLEGTTAVGAAQTR